MQTPSELKKFSVLITSGSKILTADGVEHEGKLWLVPKWHNLPDGTIRPALMIRFDNLEHQNRSLNRDYTLNLPIPQSVLDGTSTLGYETLSGADVPLYTQEKRTLH